MEALLFYRGVATSLKRWWMALAPVSISKLKQFKDKTSSSLSYWFSSEFSLRWHCASEWIHEWKHRWMHNTCWAVTEIEAQFHIRVHDWVLSKCFLSENSMWERKYVWRLPNQVRSLPWSYTCIHIVQYIMEELCVLCCAVVLYSHPTNVGNQASTFYTGDAYSAVHQMIIIDSIQNGWL